MEIYITRRAQNELSNLSVENKIRVTEKIRSLMRYRDPLVFAKYIATEKSHRWRSGDYRIFFERHAGAIHIMSIRRRDKAYD